MRMVKPPQSEAQVASWRRIVTDLLTTMRFDDLSASALMTEQNGTGVSISASENTLDFNTSANLSDYAYTNYQTRHGWVIGSDVHFHVHWKQKENATPNFLIAYRWQSNGQASETSWTYLPLVNNAFTYTSGTLNQVTAAEGLTPPTGAGLSSIIEARLFRDNSNASGEFSGIDTYSQTANISYIDCHIEFDAFGSRQEYVK